MSKFGCFCCFVLSYLIQFNQTNFQMCNISLHFLKKCKILLHFLVSMPEKFPKFQYLLTVIYTEMIVFVSGFCSPLLVYYIDLIHPEKK